MLCLGTRVFCLGGVSSLDAGLQIEASVETWESTESDYFDNPWTLIEEPLLNRMIATAFPISPTEIVIFGGNTANNEQLSDFVVYDTTNTTFRQVHSEREIKGNGVVFW